MKYIKGFDGLRAISILFVLLTHLGLDKTVQGNAFLAKNYNLISGMTGVMIFFVLSGFLITSILLNEKNSTGSINFKNFFIRRFLRLFPPLVIFFCTIAVLMLFNLISPNYIALLISSLYLYNFVPFRYYTSELGHTWTLGVEEQFYLLWPFVINRLRKIKKGFIIFLIIILLCITWKMFYSFPIYYHGKYVYLTNYFYVDRWFIPACLPIMTGALASIVLLTNKSFFQRLFYNNYLLLIASLLFYVAQLYIPGLSAQIIDIFQPVGVSIFLIWIYINQNNFLVKLLELKPVSFLGKISYGVYVYQGLFLRTGPGGNLAIQHFPLNICLVFATATASYFLIEKNVMKYKKKFKTNANKEVTLPQL